MTQGMLVANHAWPIVDGIYLAFAKKTHRERNGDIVLRPTNAAVYFFAEASAWPDPADTDAVLRLAATLDWQGPFDPVTLNTRIIVDYLDGDDTVELSHPEHIFR